MTTKQLIERRAFVALWALECQPCWSGIDILGWANTFTHKVDYQNATSPEWYFIRPGTHFRHKLWAKKLKEMR